MLNIKKSIYAVCMNLRKKEPEIISLTGFYNRYSVFTARYELKV
jgi:hypothetical protein